MPLHTLFSNTDVMTHVLQNFDSVRPLAYLACTSRTIHKAVCQTDAGRRNWLDLGVRITVGADGFEEADVRRRFHGLDSKDFFLNIKLLFCPWSSQPLFLPFAAEQRSDRKRTLRFIAGDEQNLLYATDNTRSVHRIPARPREFYADHIQTLDCVPSTVVKPSQSLRLCELGLDVRRKQVVPDFSHDRGNEFAVFPIHAGIFAVVEVMSGEFDLDHTMDNSIYFFAYKNRRMLRHIVWHKSIHLADCAVLSKPTELWMMGGDGIEYYGLANGPREVEYAPAEFVDPAFWMMGRGDSEGAIAYMRSIGAPLETRCLITGRTLLHLAAAEKHIDGIRHLLVEGFRGIDLEDEFGHTALGLAAAFLHLDVVEVLLKEGGASVEAGDFIFTEFGEFVKYRTYATCPHRANLEIETLVPGIVRLLLDAHPDVLRIDEDVDPTNNCALLSSPEAVRMILTAGYDVRLRWVVTAFKSFRTRGHELSAIMSLAVMVREFGLDFNTNDTGYGEHDTPSLLYLAEHAIAEVTIFAIEHLGADPSVVDCNGRGIKHMIARRAAGDPDSLRLLSYLGTRGL